MRISYKSFLSTLLLVFTFLVGKAQKQSQAAIDSMLRDLEITKSDTQRVNLLNELTFQSFPINPLQSLTYAKDAYLLAVGCKWEKGTATSAKFMGLVLMDLGRLDSALIMFDKSLNIYKKRNDLQEISILHYNIGAVHQRQNHFKQSIENNLTGIKYAEAIKDTGLIARGNYLIGIIFCDQKNFERARKYLFTARELYRRLQDPVSEADNLEAIGYSYILEQKFDQARVILLQGLKLYEKAGNELGKAKIYTQLGACYQNDPRTRLDYLEKSQKILTRIAPDHQYVTENKGNLGITYLSLLIDPDLFLTMPESFRTGMNRSSLETMASDNLQAGIAGARRINNPQMLASFLQSYSVLQEYRKDFKGALNSYREYTSINDSLFSQETKNRISEVESQREIDQRDKQLAIKGLELANARRTRIALIAGAGLLFVIGGLLFYQNRTRRKTNTALVKLNSELDEANKIKTRFFGILSHDLRSPRLPIWFISSTCSKKPRTFWMKIVPKHVNKSYRYLPNNF